MFYSNNFSSIRGDVCESHSGAYAAQTGGMLNHMGFTPHTDKEPGDNIIHGSLMGRGTPGRAPNNQIPGWKDGFGSGRLQNAKGGSTGNKALQAAEIPMTANARSLKGSGSATKKNTKGGYIFKR